MYSYILASLLVGLEEADIEFVNDASVRCLVDAF